jgi:hypothetical protein
LKGLAKAEYESGRILYLDGDYKTAALKFMRAYEESKDPRLLWHVAAAEKNLRHYVRVEALVRRFVTESGDKLTPEERKEAQLLLDTVRNFIAEVTLDVQPAGATIKLDGVVVGQSPLNRPIRLELGTRSIDVSKEGFLPHTETLEVTEASKLVSISLEPEIHEGKLRVLADPGSVIRVDGKVVGTSEWQGILPSGVHDVHVSADGFRPYQGDSLVQDNQTTTLRVVLQEEPKPLPVMTVVDSGGNSNAWAWVTGGLLVLGVAGTGAYFLLASDEPEPPRPVDGTLGTVELPFRF